MIAIRFGLLALLVPAGLVAQAAAPPSYRGFAPGAPYWDFAERARALARQDTLRCNTSRRTAQLMECGVTIRDPADSASFYLSAYVLEGKVAMVALYDSAGFGDTRGVPLVERTKRNLTRAFGAPRPLGIGSWEWRYGRKVVRLNWRGRGAARWISITLTDNDVMDGISRYVSRSRG